MTALEGTNGLDAGRVVRIATRGSALALAQARLVAEALGQLGVAHETVLVETEGDRRAPDTAWGEGAFVTAIERALLDGRADVAVHSAKDVPTDENPRLRICAYLPRADPRDALVLAAGAAPETLQTIAPGSVIGTDSPRRTGFLRARRPDLEVRPLHGNVDTRLRRLDGGSVDALVLAVAGLERLGRADRITERLAPDVLPPAPGQGAIAIQVRSDDAHLLALGGRIDDGPTRLAVETERAFLRAAGGGCRAPVGALAEVVRGEIVLRGGFATVDGRAVAVDTATGRVTDAPALAETLAATLSARRAHLAGGPRVLVTRPLEQSRRLAARLAEHGVEAVVVPGIEIVPAPPAGPLDGEMARLSAYDWVVLTSANAARAVTAAASRVGADLSGVRWAAVGDATARQLLHAGISAPWQPTIANGEHVAAELPLVTGERVLLPHGTLADRVLRDALSRRGAVVTEVVAYATREAPEASRPELEHAMGEPLDGAVFASPSAIRGLLSLAGPERRAALLAIPAICIGATTAAAARDAGFSVLGEARAQDESALAELAAELLAGRVAGVPA